MSVLIVKYAVNILYAVLRERERESEGMHTDNNVIRLYTGQIWVVYPSKLKYSLIIWSILRNAQFWQPILNAQKNDWTTQA